MRKIRSRTMAEKGAGPMSASSSGVGDSPEGSETSFGSNPHERHDDANLAFEGITLLLNNEWDKAQALYSKYKYVNRCRPTDHGL